MKKFSLLLIGLLLSYSLLTQSTKDLWGEIRERMVFDHALDHPSVIYELEKYNDNQYVINRLAKNGQRYLYYTVSESIKRDLPVELALLPFVESQFEPFAQSPTGASGIWQFILSTAREQKLKKNWWYDGRRDIVASTGAAYNYLTELHSKYDNWLLAIAAYNAGPNRISKEIKKNIAKGLSIDFWSLNLPKETKAYVPKLLALAEVIKNPDKYSITIPNLPNRPYFQLVTLPSQVDLMQVANISGLKLEVVYELNPGFTQWATDPNGPFRILLPVGIADRFQVNLNNMDPSELVQWDRYLVKKGDTLTSIAKKYLIDSALLKEINGLKDDTIYENEELQVPRGPSWIKDFLNKPDIYYVKAGDSMWSIAKRFNVTIKDLSIWNDLNPAKFLLTGTKILIYPKYFKEIKPKPIPKNDIVYPVKRGDSIIKISNKFGIPKEWILKWNDIPDETLIYPGQIIELRLSEIN